MIGYRRMWRVAALALLCSLLAAASPHAPVLAAEPPPDSPPPTVGGGVGERALPSSSGPSTFLVPTLALAEPRPAPSPRPGPANTIILAFTRPFAGSPPVTAYFDHDLPFEFQDSDGAQLTFWGERVYPYLDGHDGYDFSMPAGTPVFAVANGRVVAAGPGPSFTCPTLGDRTVQNTDIMVEHIFRGLGTNNDDLVLRTIYTHVGRIDVQEGQVVRQGEQLGLSGNVGCSTGPHLHFEVNVRQGDNFIAIDPYGWEGAGSDPWAQHPQGAPSIWLWQDGHAPPLYSDAYVLPNPGLTDNAWVAITRARWQSWGTDPNREFLELTLDPRFAPTLRHNMTGYAIRTNAGANYRFPDGFVIESGRPVSVLLGAGVNSPSTLYWGGARLNPLGDCPRLIRPGGGSYPFPLGPSGICS